MGASPNLSFERITPDNLRFAAHKGQVVIRGKCGQRFRIERQDVPELIELLQFAKEWADDQVAESPRLQRVESERKQFAAAMKEALRPLSYTPIEKVIYGQS